MKDISQKLHADTYNQLANKVQTHVYRSEDEFGEKKLNWTNIKEETCWLLLLLSK